jgi:hypothetical protein
MASNILPDPNSVSDEVLQQQEHVYQNLYKNENTDDASNHGSVLMQFIKNMRPGMDTTSVICPTFVLRPISFLEFEAHYSQPNESFLQIAHAKEPLQRMMNVVKWLLACFTVTPAKGFEGLKPYNPVLGEQFHAEWQHDDGSITEFHSEQVSHHPPIAAVYMQNLKNHIIYSSTGEFRSRFRGNYVDSAVEGLHRLSILNHEDEHYDITFPHLLARGILWGSARVEHGADYIVECEKTGFIAKINFDKGDHELKGSVKLLNKDEKLFEIKGNLADKITIVSFVDEAGRKLKDKRTDVLFDCKTMKREKFIVKPVHLQKPNESRRRWHEVTYALKTNQMDLVTKKKTEIEEYQRYLAKLRKEGQLSPYVPDVFEYTGKEIPKLGVPLYQYKQLPTAVHAQANDGGLDDDLD